MATRKRPKLGNRELERRIDDIYTFINDESDRQRQDLDEHKREHERERLENRIQELEEENAALQK